jgi:hypothetical protein
VDNTKKTISFSSIRELFDHKVLNVFSYTNFIGKKFDAIGALKTILEYAYVNSDDVQRLLPLDIIMQGCAQGAMWLVESGSMNILDFIHQMFDSYRVYVEFDLKANT